MKITNPATGAILQEIEEDSAKSIEEKFKRAQSFQPSWAKTPLAEKISILGRFKELLSENKARLAAVLTSETGKPITQSKNEINGVGPRIDFFTQNVEKLLADETVLSDSAQKLEE